MKPTILLTLLLTLTASAFEFTGKVVGVADGDTITVLYQGNKQYKVRLQHIDCLEVGQPFATKAKKNVSVRWRILSAQVL
jgi:endonuclease YncB( thermonuclease family)